MRQQLGGQLGEAVRGDKRAGQRLAGLHPGLGPGGPSELDQATHQRHVPREAGSISGSSATGKSARCTDSGAPG